MMRTGFFIFLSFFVGLPAEATERGLAPARILDSTPAPVVRLEKTNRMPASMDETRARQRAALRALDEQLPVGAHAIIRNSVDEWNNQVVQVTARYDDGARQIRLDNGQLARVRFENLATLSPSTNRCCPSHGTTICPGETVYHPLPTTSLGVPEGRVQRVFENCTMIVRDGLEFIYDAQQLGKAVNCSPQKESVCVGRTVYVEGYRDGRRYEFEGPVTQVYSNGTALVRTGLWLLPIDATTARVQTEILPNASPQRPSNSAVITSRDGQGKLPVPTYQELEPVDPGRAQEVDDQRGITIPAQ